MSLTGTWDVALTEWEFTICKWLANERYQSARKAGVKDAQIGPQPSAITDLVGICGEFAFCKAFNCVPDLTIGPRSGGVDACLHGMTIDVKTTARMDGNLLAPLKKASVPCDAYVLVLGSDLQYVLAGWAFADELLHEDQVDDLGWGPGYVMWQDELHPMGELESAARTYA